MWQQRLKPKLTLLPEWYLEAKSAKASEEDIRKNMEDWLNSSIQARPILERDIDFFLKLYEEEWQRYSDAEQ